MPHDLLHAWLRALGVSLADLRFIAFWPSASSGTVEVQLGPQAFWALVARTGAPVRTTHEPPRPLLPYTHRATLDGVEFFTYSQRPVTPPGSVTTGYVEALT